MWREGGSAMPIHDWTRVDHGTFHDFHSSWIIHLKEALNQGLLPPDYYALAEQVATRHQTDVLTLRADHSGAPGGTLVAEAAPTVRMRARPTAVKPYRPSPRTRVVNIRHVTDHQVVAVLEIASPANKDRKANVADLAGKIARLLRANVQVLLIDLLPPGRYDPLGLHGAVWAHFDREPYQPSADEPLTLVSYRWDEQGPEAFVEPVALGRSLIDMPLFLNSERYVNVPLETTYQAAYRGVPAFWRARLDAPAAE
jgi:hypothetical protein